MVGWAPEAHLNVPLLDRGVYTDIDHWLRARRIDEIDGAALQDVAVALENQVTTINVHAAQDHGLGGRAAYAQVGCALQAEFPAHQVYAAGRAYGDIEFQVLAKAHGRRRRSVTAKLPGEAHQIEVGSERELINFHLAAQKRSFSGAGQGQVCVNTGADAFRVKQANTVAGDGEIELQCWAIDHTT